MPPTLNVSLNQNLQLPVGMDPNNLPIELQQLLQQMQTQMVQQLLPDAEEAVKQAIAAQAPLTNLSVNYRGGKWIKMKSADASGE